MTSSGTATAPAGRTLPDHDWCTTHRVRKLGCDQYERLIARSANQCEICRLPAAQNTRRKLAIDHRGHAWAVRGLLCNSCNVKLTEDAERYEWCSAYLANSWWVRECERLGIPAVLAPEPGIGSVIRDQWNTYWIRERDGKWRPHGRGRPGISWLSWERIYELRGPQNMAVLDLRSGAYPEWLRYHIGRLPRAEATA